MSGLPSCWRNRLFLIVPRCSSENGVTKKNEMVFISKSKKPQSTVDYQPASGPSIKCISSWEIFNSLHSIIPPSHMLRRLSWTKHPSRVAKGKEWICLRPPQQQQATQPSTLWFVMILSDPNPSSRVVGHKQSFQEATESSRTIRVCRTIVITSLFPNKPRTFHLHYLDFNSLLPTPPPYPTLAYCFCNPSPISSLSAPLHRPLFKVPGAAALV